MSHLLVVAFGLTLIGGAPAAPTEPPPELGDRSQPTATDSQRQIDQAREARWLELAQGEDVAALEALVAEDPDLPFVSDAKKRIAFLTEVATTLSALSTAAATLPDKTDEAATLLERVRPQARGSAQIDRELGRLACLLAAATDEATAGFAAAFAVLRERETHERWPCNAEQTDLVWTRFKSSFDDEVEIRADFPGAYAYLSRWHAVLERFRVIALNTGAKQAEIALLAMLMKVERVAKKLPPAESCVSPESQKSLCSWVCAAKHRAGVKRCAAFKIDKAQMVCDERNEAELAGCAECCDTEGKQCPAKRTLHCKPVEVAAPEAPEYEN
jgi:hypothetical protein